MTQMIHKIYWMISLPFLSTNLKYTYFIHRYLINAMLANAGPTEAHWGKRGKQVRKFHEHGWWTLVLNDLDVKSLSKKRYIYIIYPQYILKNLPYSRAGYNLYSSALHPWATPVSLRHPPLRRSGILVIFTQLFISHPSCTLPIPVLILVLLRLLISVPS